MKLYQCDPSEVIVSDDRARKEFRRGPLFELERSIQRHGQLQPGVCCLGEGGVYNLVAGERRLRACQNAQVPFTFILHEDIKDPIKLREIELDENLKREDLTWQEEVKAKEELHNLKQTLYGTATPGQKGGQRLEDTAKELGETKGLLSKDLELANWMDSLPEVREAKNKTEAKKIVKRAKEQMARSILLEKATEAAAEPSKSRSGQAEDALAWLRDNPLPEGSTKEEKKEIELVSKRLLEFNKRIIHGTFEEEIKNFKKGTIDIVLFDPPWAVGFDQVRLSVGSTKGYSDDLEENIKKLPLWLESLYERMSPESHLYMFFGIINHELVYNTLEAVGFVTNRIPIIWHKAGARRTRNPKIWSARCYEPIAFARKGNRNLVWEGAPDLVTTNPAPNKLRKEHVSAKHPDIYLNLLQRSARPGDTVLDPMCGSGASLVACDQMIGELQLDYWGIEQDQDFRELSVVNLTIGYHRLTEPDFVPEGRKDAYLPKGEELPLDFQGLEIGGNQWKSYWKAHPEKQEEMLDWKTNATS